MGKEVGHIQQIARIGQSPIFGAVIYSLWSAECLRLHLKLWTHNRYWCRRHSQGVCRGTTGNGVGIGLVNRQIEEP